MLLIGTSRESVALIERLGKSQGIPIVPEARFELDSSLSIQRFGSRAKHGCAPLKTRLMYVDENQVVPTVPRSPVDGNEVFVSPDDLNSGEGVTICLRGRNGGIPIEELFLSRIDLPIDKILRNCLSLVYKGCVVLAASPVFEIIRRSHGVLNLNHLPVVRFRPTRLKGLRVSVKRVIDVMGATAATIVLSPIFAAAAVLIKLTSPGPVFFKQTRVGKSGREFTFYKFRSMVSGDDSKYREYLKAFVEDGRAAGVDSKGHKVYKIIDDPRITHFGRFLRRTSLDEFPQLINVFKGDMSLVGPRPCLPYEWELYEDWQKARLSVTPGLTGIWQVTGRSNVSFHHMVILDLYYVSNWSFLMDLKLIFQTIPVILLGKGAH